MTSLNSSSRCFAAAGQQPYELMETRLSISENKTELSERDYLLAVDIVSMMGPMVPATRDIAARLDTSSAHVSEILSYFVRWAQTAWVTQQGKTRKIHNKMT